MGSVNKVILVGNLGRDPELRHAPSGAAVASFTIATNEVWTNKDGQREVKTEWHRVVAFGKLAEICCQYLTKGKQVYLEGRLQTRSWEDRDGNKRYATEIVASNMVMLGRAPEPGADGFAPPLNGSGPGAEGPGGGPEDDIPF